MSQAQIEQFYTRVKGDPALMQQLMSESSTPDEFVAGVVAKGNEMGFEFTNAEAASWIEQQRNVSESGELSGVQLEAVAGGKSVSSVRKDFHAEMRPIANELKPYFSGW